MDSGSNPSLGLEGKQERRSGIETCGASDFPSFSMGKQERRSGIETWLCGAVMLGLDIRSRNAVVALKRSGSGQEEPKSWLEAGTP